jgi:ketosteroid isomerase-like protein
MSPSTTTGGPGRCIAVEFIYPMKTFTRLLLLLSLAVASLAAADDKLTAAVRAADDERLAATQAGDPARLDAIFSNQLHYAHSSGKVDTKESYVKSLTSRSTIYESFDYQTRNFTLAGPGVVLMTGRVVIHASNDGEKVINDLNFLAVWREEAGKWRFLAWQSCKNPPVAKP